MLNKMDKFDIFVPHPLVITSLLPLECGCKPLVCLLKRPVLLSLDFQDRSIRDYSSCTLVGVLYLSFYDTPTNVQDE